MCVSQWRKQEIGADNYQLYQEIKAFSKMSGAQMRMPFSLRIE